MQHRLTEGPTSAPVIRSVARDERGLTLIELLTGLLLFGMITSILYSFLFMGASMYRKISVETQLRNQADALYGRIMTELKDAVYVQQGLDASGKINEREIVFVKRASDPAVYVETYTMTIEQDSDGSYGLTVTGPGSSDRKRFDLTPRFKLNEAESRLIAEKQNRVKVLLVFERADAAAVPDAEDAKLVLETSIPLFRME